VHIHAWRAVERAVAAGAVERAVVVVAVGRRAVDLRGLGKRKALFLGDSALLIHPLLLCRRLLFSLLVSYRPTLSEG
jgi:hypothetical protein